MIRVVEVIPLLVHKKTKATGGGGKINICPLSTRHKPDTTGKCGDQPPMYTSEAKAPRPEAQGLGDLCRSD